VNTRENGLKPWLCVPTDKARRFVGSLTDRRYTTSVFNGTNGLPKSNEDLLDTNCGINLTNPTPNRAGGWRENLKWWL